MQMKKHDLRNAFKKRGGFARRGFALIEALCSFVILGIALTGFIASIAGAFEYTTEIRARMKNYAEAEKAALEAGINGGLSSGPGSEPFLKKAVSVQSITSAGANLSFDVILWSAPLSPGRKRANPVIVTIQGKKAL